MGKDLQELELEQGSAQLSQGRERLSDGIRREIPALTASGLGKS